MASSSDRGTKEVLCRYFANNACSKGADCPFSHDRTAKPDLVCRYYLAGGCSYGDKCRYDHVHPARLSGTSYDSQSKKDSGSARGNELVTTTGVSNSVSTSKPSSSKSAWNPNAKASVALLPLCPYFENGFCQKGPDCQFVHGLICEICGKAALHPGDEEQCKKHRRECEAAKQLALEVALAEERSADKVCGICMENVWERKVRFGILQRCKHCFCLDCIRKWRSNRNEMFEKELVRSCPECRVCSDFVVPAQYWVEETEEKELLIAQYREANKKIQCKYVVGDDVSGCPFGNKCFFKHELPDGTIVEGESPRLLRKLERRTTIRDIFDFDAYESDSDSDFEIREALDATILFLDLQNH